MELRWLMLLLTMKTDGTLRTLFIMKTGVTCSDQKFSWNGQKQRLEVGRNVTWSAEAATDFGSVILSANGRNEIATGTAIDTATAKNAAAHAAGRDQGRAPAGETTTDASGTGGPTNETEGNHDRAQERPSAVIESNLVPSATCSCYLAIWSPRSVQSHASLLYSAFPQSRQQFLILAKVHFPLVCVLYILRPFPVANTTLVFF